MRRALITLVALAALAVPAAVVAQEDAPPPTELWNEYPLEEGESRPGGGAEQAADPQPGGAQPDGAVQQRPAQSAEGRGGSAPAGGSDGEDDSGGSGVLIAILAAVAVAAAGVGAWALRRRGRKARPRAVSPPARPKRPSKPPEPVGGNMVPEGYVRPPPGRLATEMPEPEPEPEPAPKPRPAPAIAARPSRRAIGYTSAPALEDENDADARSEGATIEAACRRLGLEFGELVQDRAVGPDASPSRPGLAYALEKIADGEASCLIVSGLDRLSLSAADLGALIESLSERGARLVVADIDLDTATRDGRLAAWALMTVGGLERTREGERRALDKGGRRRRRAPAKPKARDVPVLKKRIAQMRSDGMTLQAIADKLNEEGVPTLRGGARWRPSSVQAAVGYKRPSRKGPAKGPKGSAKAENGQDLEAENGQGVEADGNGSAKPSATARS